jgi:hypothetical protein
MIGVGQTLKDHRPFASSAMKLQQSSFRQHTSSRHELSSKSHRMNDLHTLLQRADIFEG